MADATALQQQIFTAYDRLCKARQLTPRAAQRTMILAISEQALAAAEAATERPILVVEGPTGTGKTVAYLLGAIPIAQALGLKVVVATATVALQEQLIERDIPDLQQHTGLKFSVAIALGRSRFVCINHLQQYAGEAIAQPSLLPDLMSSAAIWHYRPTADDLTQVRQLYAHWQQQRWDGCRDSLDPPPSESLWQQLTTDSERCIGSRCSNAVGCPFRAAREGLHEADVIVANHDLVLANLAIDAGILPPLAKTLLIFDEGHHLANKAMRQFQGELPLQQFQKEVTQLAKWLAATGEELPTPTPALVQAIRELAPLADDSLNGSRHLLTALRSWSFDAAESSGGTQNTAPRERLQRMVAGELPDPLRQLAATLREPVQALARIATQLRSAVTETLDRDDLDPQKRSRLESALPATAIAGNRLSAALRLLDYSADADAEGDVPHARWFRDSGDELWLLASPITAAPLLQQQIWQQVGAAVITSATLTALGSFDRIARACGLTGERTRFLQLPSPFDYAQRATLTIAAMRSQPHQEAHFLSEVVAQLSERIDPKEGTLVLFTSHRMMQQVAEQLPPALREQLRVQGTQSKQRLLRDHQTAIDNGSGSTLFGVASFAEGIDLRGDYCRHVVIVRLPFSPPDSPIEATQADYLKRRGIDPFMRLTLPATSLKLIQACGRLLRTESDYGRVTILDRRLVTKAYGQQLLAALPPFRLDVEPLT